MPDGADEFLFKIAPYVSFCASLAAFMAHARLPAATIRSSRST